MAHGLAAAVGVALASWVKALLVEGAVQMTHQLAAAVAAPVAAAVVSAWIRQGADLLAVADPMVVAVATEAAMA
jgi:hypothetical protein